MVEVSGLESTLPVFLIQTREEHLELLLQVIKCEELFQRIEVEHFIFPVVLRLSSIPVRTSFLANLPVPSEEEFSEVVEDSPV